MYLLNRYPIIIVTAILLPGNLSIVPSLLTFSKRGLLGTSNSSTGLEVSFVSLLCYVDINSHVLPSSSQ